MQIDTGDHSAHSHSNSANSFSLHHLTFSGTHTDLVTHIHTPFCSPVSVRRSWTSGKKSPAFSWEHCYKRRKQSPLVHLLALVSSVDRFLNVKLPGSVLALHSHPLCSCIFSCKLFFFIPLFGNLEIDRDNMKQIFYHRCPLNKLSNSKKWEIFFGFCSHISVSKHCETCWACFISF